MIKLISSIDYFNSVVVKHSWVSVYLDLTNLLSTKFNRPLLEHLEPVYVDVDNPDIALRFSPHLNYHPFGFDSDIPMNDINTCIVELDILPHTFECPSTLDYISDSLLSYVKYLWVHRGASDHPVFLIPNSIHKLPNSCKVQDLAISKCGSLESFVSSMSKKSRYRWNTTPEFTYNILPSSINPITLFEKCYLMSDNFIADEGYVAKEYDSLLYSYGISRVVSGQSIGLEILIGVEISAYVFLEIIKDDTLNFTAVVSDYTNGVIPNIGSCVMKAISQYLHTSKYSLVRLNCQDIRYICEHDEELSLSELKTSISKQYPYATYKIPFANVISDTYSLSFSIGDSLENFSILNLGEA